MGKLIWAQKLWNLESLCLCFWLQTQDLPLVCFTKALQSESRLCRLEGSVSKQLCVIICSAEVIIFYSKLEHSVDSNTEMLLP